MRKILAVGHFLNADFQSACAKHLGRIRETFFAWPGVLSCRPSPDFASHVDIHNKPGYDPKELFFFNNGVVKGTHGRACQVAMAV